MPSVDVFHKIFVVQREIEQPTRELLQLWFPTFLKQIESQLSLPVGQIEAPKPENYTSRNAYEELPGSELPKVVVISPGLIGTPLMSGNGQFRATWRLGIAVATTATDEETAKLHCDIYGAVVREIMLKRGGKALGAKVNWVDEQYADLPLGDVVQRYRAASQWFAVDVENVATKRGGPDTPNQEPYDYHTAQTVNVTKTKEPVNG